MKYNKVSVARTPFAVRGSIVKSSWAMAMLGTWLASQPARAGQASESAACTSDVLDRLGEQGEWLTLFPEGPAWRPNPDVVDENFVPHVTGGMWTVRDGAQFFASRWSWGDVVFNSGRWTLKDDQGWLWLPDQSCLNPSAAMASNDEPLLVAAFLLPIEAHSTKHPPGAPFTHPHGPEGGHASPAGVQGPMPASKTPASAAAAATRVLISSQRTPH